MVTTWHIIAADLIGSAGPQWSFRFTECTSDTRNEVFEGVQVLAYY